jgi:hypothetical protein
LGECLKKYIMKVLLACLFFVLTSLDRSSYYKAMKGEDKQLVNAQITELETIQPPLKDAFLGAMLMKKAGLGGAPATKLKLFKQGRKMLESAIKQDPDNAEFRFLRLIVQENSPSVLGYHNDIKSDAEFIRKSYNSLSPDLKEVIADYSKKSKNLKPGVS